jgi:hypothetical protein
MASTYEGPTKALDMYEAVVAGNPEVERRGATMPYTSLNGHMFSFLDKTGAMALRLPEDPDLSRKPARARDPRATVGYAECSCERIYSATVT